MEVFRKFYMHLQKICSFTMQHTKVFAAFFKHFLRNILNQKINSIFVLVVFSCKIFHAAWKTFYACYSFLHAIENSVLATIYSFHDFFLLWLPETFIFSFLWSSNHRTFDEQVKISTTIIELKCPSVRTKSLIFRIKSIPREYTAVACEQKVCFCLCLNVIRVTKNQCLFVSTNWSAYC